MSATAPKVMTLSREEMKSNALAFAKRWRDTSGVREEADAKSFLDEFFSVFGRDRKLLATHEHRVERAGRSQGRIDLFWPGKFLVEMKSPGRDLDEALKQALGYVADLAPDEVPQWVMVSDFATLRLYDLGERPHELLNAFKVEKNRKASHAASFTLAELPDKLRHFAFIRDEEQHLFQSQPDINVKAVALLGELHDSLKKDSSYTGHKLERFLVRILFCLFAEDTDIFPWQSFANLVRATKRDGSDLGASLAKLFQTLDTPERERAANLPALYSVFPYVNGGLFAERLDFADMDAKQREALVACCAFDWSKISPAVFGSLFQGVMDPKERRAKGAHYTSEENIRKVIDPLFLDDLKAELAKIRVGAGRAKALEAFHQKLAGLRFFDPACGCGNFLVVAYRELRALELETLRARWEGDTLPLGYDFSGLAKVNVDQFYGIEIEEFPALIAETALWLTDHQVNIAFSKAFGCHYLRIPLKKSAKIVPGNALRIDWREVIAPKDCSFILGNPPFVGSKMMDDAQSADRDAVFPKLKTAGVLDYVACWYRKAVDYLAENPAIHAAFVSTNSITQGEQVAAMWPDLMRRGLKLYFAYRTFKWANDASGKAAVHCVIIGFGLTEPNQPIRLYDSPDSADVVRMRQVKSLNAYLIEGDPVFIYGRLTPISSAQPVANGSIPADGGNLILSPSDAAQLSHAEPAAKSWIHRYLGADDFINNGERYCLWLKNCPPAQLRSMPLVLQRLQGVQTMRASSDKAATRAKAATPTLFTEDRQPATGHYLVIPRTSSELRPYIPIGFLDSAFIANNDLQIVPNATPYDFGVITSKMHLAWVGVTSGRMKSDYRYSVKLSYNTFPWPTPDDTKRATIEKAAQAVLDARAPHLVGGSSLADLYDPLTMPAGLRKAHDALDRAVDAAYGYKGASDGASRTAFLFKLYKELTAPLAPDTKPAKGKRKTKSAATTEEVAK